MPEWTKHINSRFDGALYDLRNDILMMSTLTDRMFQNAITGLLERNTELCDQVEADDEEVRELALVERPRSLASGIFRDSIRAFAEGDCELARTLIFKDRELDDAINEVIERLSARASLGSDAARSCLDLIFIARALERIGDNATSIAEDSFWRDEGDDIRHSYPPKKTNHFSRQTKSAQINR